MLTALLTGLAGTALGAVLGILTRRTLATLSYRLDDEQDLPVPGQRWWIIWTSALSLGSITTWIAATNSWALAPVLLPLTLAGPALAAIDLDVMRLPNRILGPAALITLAGLSSTLVANDDRTIAVRGLIGGAITGATFWLMNTLTSGGVGFGDVKLAALVGCVTGSIGLHTVWLGLLLGTLAAITKARSVRSNGPIAYGPWLLVGGWAATLTSLATSFLDL